MFFGISRHAKFSVHPRNNICASMLVVLAAPLSNTTIGRPHLSSPSGTHTLGQGLPQQNRRVMYTWTIYFPGLRLQLEGPLPALRVLYQMGRALLAPLQRLGGQVQCNLFVKLLCD